MGSELAGQVALVTGGVRGIGLAISEALMAQGARVAAGFSRNGPAAESFIDSYADRGATIHQGTIEDHEDCERVVGEVIERHGRLDILVNNAGTTTFVDHRNLDALTAEIWDRTLAVNVKGTFFCSRAAARVMPDGGRIINIGSVAGVAGSGSSIAYAASKGAIHTMTKSFARALAPRITVNAIAPGLIETRWHVGREAFIAAHVPPVQRIGRPEDIAHLALALATADNFITGQIIVADGGALL